MFSKEISDFSEEMVLVFRRLISLLLLSIALCSLCLPAFAANTMQQGSMYVNTANGRALRFRSSKSTSADNILAEIPYGTKVYVITWDGTWARVRYNSAVGYVVKKHLSIARPAPYEQVEAERAWEEAIKKQEQETKAANKKLDHSRLKKVTPYDVTVRTGTAGPSATVYKKADLTADIVTEYAEGERLVVREENRDWALVYDGNSDQTGYMLREDLEKDLFEEEILDD